MFETRIGKKSGDTICPTYKRTNIPENQDDYAARLMKRNDDDDGVETKKVTETKDWSIKIKLKRSHLISQMINCMSIVHAGQDTSLFTLVW